MPRLRRDSTNNELARDGTLVTALGLHFPKFVMYIILVKEGEKKCAVRWAG